MSPRRAVRVDPSELLAATATLEPAERAEMAVPSYGHRNPLIRWLFWQRLDTAIRLADLRAGQAVVDYGSGTGILLPTLAQAEARIVATDLDVRPSRSFASSRGVAAEFVENSGFRTWADRHSGTVDRIFALDVLEHVETDELRDLSLVFRSLLRPDGRLIVSGPTESAAYRIGRALAGFKNVYHHRSIFNIDAALAAHWHPVARVFIPRRPLPRAFEITSYAAR